ncbi:group 3 secretory phospholipase A2-like isoform X1 [Homarus americanus]|uniref:group 3 secretory phospholipase A2-like isoform X1 n=1 Tax=Homarus americanus TaxID=6706 RepID=UPI001C44B690|nr:group 3 secretory phospholipase A2-like isoform X1 [Homarus americanus]
MNLLSVALCALGCLLSCLSAAGHRIPNFIAHDNLSDGQHEIRLHYNSVSAKQTSVTRDQGSESGLVLRQVSHRRHLLTLIYVGEVTDHLSVDGLSLRDCELTSDPAEVEPFLDTFNADVEIARNIPTGSWSGQLHNVSFVHLDSESELPEYLRPITHFRELRAQCKAHHRSVRKAVKAQRRLERAQHNQPQETHSRSRRAVLEHLRLFPTTKWCGVGYSASVYGDLGGSSGADKCCRQHDLHCPYYISSFETKYGLMNWSIGTINHCGCDERFKACLKMSRTAAADMVGNVFFNVVKTRCFRFQKQKVCRKWSWWGRCEKYAMKNVAVLRDNVPYST